MSVPQFRDDLNRVQPGVLGQCSGYNLESFGEGLETVGFFAFQGLGVLDQETGEVDLGCAAAGYQGSTPSA